MNGKKILLEFGLFEKNLKFLKKFQFFHFTRCSLKQMFTSFFYIFSIMKYWTEGDCARKLKTHMMAWK